MKMPTSLRHIKTPSIFFTDKQQIRIRKPVLRYRIPKKGHLTRLQGHGNSGTNDVTRRGIVREDNHGGSALVAEGPERGVLAESHEVYGTFQQYELLGEIEDFGAGLFCVFVKQLYCFFNLLMPHSG